MSVRDICYAYSLKSDASCLNGAPRAPTQSQACAKNAIAFGTRVLKRYK